MISQLLEPSRPLDDIAPLGRIGLVALSTDFNSEQDLRRFYPAGVELFTSRVANHNPMTLENLRAMAPGITGAAELILPGIKLDVMVYGCTAGTLAIGQDRIEDLIRLARPGVPVTTPLQAGIEGCRALGASRISLLTPYTEDVNLQLAEQFTARGFEVLSVAGLGFTDDRLVTGVSPLDIADAAVAACDPLADLLFISCTALRASLAIEAIETRLGKPVVSSNQAIAWHSLRLLGYTGRIEHFGRLFEQTADDSSASLAHLMKLPTDPGASPA